MGLRVLRQVLYEVQAFIHGGQDCHIIMITITYVLAPVYKPPVLHTGRDVHLAGPRARRKRKAGSLKVQRSPKAASRTNTISRWPCGSASHRLALIIVWQLATLKEVRTSSLALRLVLNAPDNSVRPHTH